MTDTHHELRDVAEQADLHGSPVGVLEDRFDSSQELLNFISTGNLPSEVEGVGKKTSRKLMWWVEDEHEDVLHDYREADESVFTEFETEKDACGSTSAEGEPVWGAYCPQEECGHLNLFEGDPDGFAGRPYSCQNCNWVSLMNSTVSDLEVA